MRADQREWRGKLAQAGIPHEFHELPGAHFVRRDMLQRDIDGVIARLRKARRPSLACDHEVPAGSDAVRRKALVPPPTVDVVG